MLVQSDNKTVVAFIRKQGGTRSRVLLGVVKKLLSLSGSPSSNLADSFYLPGHYNRLTDRLSRGLSLID